jgi:hypothetical protein
VSRTRRALVGGLAIAVAIAVIGTAVVYAAVGSPTIPGGAAAVRIAIGENPDAGALSDPTGDAAFDPTTNSASACLDRIVRPGGWLDLCWQVSRLMNESDPAQDYYLLRVWGTLHGNPAPSGLRWAVIRAVLDPASAPINYRLEWPGPNVYDGGCQDTTADTGGPFPEEATTVCGRTTGLTSTSQADATGLVWTCAGCFLPMSTDQGVLMTYGTAVPEGGTPIWDVYADIGS